MTRAQHRVYQAVKDSLDENGYPPTVREIGSRLGLASPSTVHTHLLALCRLGYLAMNENQPRTLRVLA